MQRVATQIPKMYCTYFLKSIQISNQRPFSPVCSRALGVFPLVSRRRAAAASGARVKIIALLVHERCRPLQRGHHWCKACSSRTRLLCGHKSRSCNFEPMTPHTFQHENIIPLWVQFKRECNTLCALRRWLSCLGELQSTLGVIIVAVILHLSWR